MGNVAYKMGGKILWDKETGSFKDPEANAVARVHYHNGW